MCGFVGSWHPNGRPPLLLGTALESIAHRGPDGEGWYRSERCMLGHRRLSIIDVDGGKQPLKNEFGDLHLVHNGEIYNHAQLMRSLSGDHQPRTQSDGEAWLHIAEEHGMGAAVERIHGMFALAATDGKNFCLARDPLGIKPLYWSRYDGGIVFGSEIKSLVPLVPPELIEEFPPGHKYSDVDGLTPFWDVPQGWSGDKHECWNLSTWSDAILAEVSDAVDERMMADVPIGVFLSGGLDSSLIAALMRRRVDELHTFAVGTPGSNDLRRAREVADTLKTIHHELVISECEITEALEDVIWHLESWDRDLIRSAIPCWFVSREAARHVKVVLTGEGADELFAGYGYYRQYGTETLHQELRRSVRNLHHINLQRVDRMSMAHGLEARVPFLSTDVVELALSIPPAFKLKDGVDKFVLRHAAARIIPQEIAWRAKEQFDQGSGSAAFLDRHFGSADVEAAYYRTIFNRRFPHSVEALVAHWDRDRLDGNTFVAADHA